MSAANLILIAPCSLLLGAALQILVAKLCFRADKGNPGRTVLPAVADCRRGHGAPGPGRPGDRCEPVRMGWAARAGAARGCAERAVRADGRGHRRIRAALLHRLHGARQVRDALLRHDAGVHRRVRRAGVQRQPVHLLPVLGSGRVVLLQPGGLLVHESRSRERRAQGAADDAHRGLRIAGRHPGDLSSHRKRAVDRSRGGACVHRAACSC